MSLKVFLKDIRRRLLRATGIPEALRDIMSEKKQSDSKASYVNRGVQQLLAIKYRESFQKCGRLFDFDDIEFRNHSQNGEDGILWYIFSLLGTINKKSVEVCAGDGTHFFPFCQRISCGSI